MANDKKHAHPIGQEDAHPEDKKETHFTGPKDSEKRLAALEKWAGEVAALIALNGWSHVPTLSDK